MNTLPKNVQKRVTVGTALSPELASREADRLDSESRYAYLDGRTAHAKKLSGYANQLRRMARQAA